MLTNLRVRYALKRAQQLVAQHDPHPRYGDSYREAETEFWSHVPSWIWEDFRDSGAARSLDVGCAYGTLLVFTRLVTGCTGYGTDFKSVYMSDQLRRSQSLEFAEANIELDPIPWDLTFDIIVFTEVLEHLCFQAAPTLRKLGERLSPGGRIYLSTPDSSEWGITDRYYARYIDLPMPKDELRHLVTDDHIWQFSEAEVLEVVRQAGLEVLRFEYSPGVAGRHFNLTLVPS